MSNQNLTAQYVDPVVLNQIKYHIDSLSNLMNNYGVKIVVEAQSGYTALLPKEYSVVADDDPSAEVGEPVCLDDFLMADLPISSFDSEYQKILPDE